MKNKKELIEELKKRDNRGENITLLCWEKNDEFCHRRLLKELIKSSYNLKGENDELIIGEKF